MLGGSALVGCCTVTACMHCLLGWAKAALWGAAIVASAYYARQWPGWWGQRVVPSSKLQGERSHCDNVALWAASRQHHSGHKRHGPTGLHGVSGWHVWTAVDDPLCAVSCCAVLCVRLV